MGCVVNGPGEAREADLGIAAGRKRGHLFVKGEVVRVVPESQMVDALVEWAQIIDEGGVEVAAVVREETGGPAVEDHEGLRGRGGAEIVGDLAQQLVERRAVHQVVGVLPSHGEGQVMERVGDALGVVVVVVGPRERDRCAVRLGRLHQARVRVAEEVCRSLGAGLAFAAGVAQRWVMTASE